MKTYVLERLKEPSTWAGVALIVQMAAQAAAAPTPGAIGATVAAVLAMLMPERRAT